MSTVHTVTRIEVRATIEAVCARLQGALGLEQSSDVDEQLRVVVAQLGALRRAKWIWPERPLT